MRLRWPAWFPYPSSWLYALVLGLLFFCTIAFWVRVGITLGISPGDANDIALALTILPPGLLSPILTVAVVHHLLGFITSQIPGLQSSEVKNKRIFPGIISWWEGIWAWTSIILSLIMSMLVGIVVSMLSGQLIPLITSQRQISNQDSETFGLILTVAWFVTAAYLCQIHYLAKQRLLKVCSKELPKSMPKTPTSKSAPTTDPIETELNQLRSEQQKRKPNQ